MKDLFKGITEGFLFFIIMVIGGLILFNSNMSRDQRELTMLGVFVVSIILIVYIRHKGKNWSILYGIGMFFLITTVVEIRESSAFGFGVLIIFSTSILYNTLAYLNKE